MRLGNPPMTSDGIVQKGTGETVRGLLWMAAGAAFVAVVVAPYLTRMLGIGAALAMILAGVAIAYFTGGGFRKAAQGAAMFGVASLAMTYLAPIFARVVPGAGAQKKASGPRGVFI